MENPVRTSTREIVKNLKYVNINYENIHSFVQKILQFKYEDLSYLNKLQTDNDEKKLIFLLLMHSNGFCFWNNRTERWHYTFKNGKRDKGQFGFIQAWIDYFNADTDRFNFDYFSNLSFISFKEIYQGGENLMFLKKRHENIIDISRRMIAKCEGSVIEFIKSSDNKLENLLPLITTTFTAYTDQVTYKGEVIYFWKLAQLFVYDVIDNFPNKSFGHFDDINYLSGLADYKLPQLFEENKLVSYTHNLYNKIVNKELIRHGSREEVEIRSVAVQLVDLIYKEYRPGYFYW